MTDKEFRRLKRPQLIEIIYQLQLEQQKLIDERNELQQRLDNWQSKIEEAGSIAEATVAVSNIFEVAQKTAEQYLNEIRIKREETDEECVRVLQEARTEADRLRKEARETQ